MLTIVIPMIAVVAIFLAEIAFIRQAKSYMPNQGIAVPKPAKIPPEKQKASESEPIIWRRFKPYNPMDASGHTRLSDYLLSIMSASEVKRLLDVLQGRTEKKAIVITGRQGPTGKTTLAEVLKKSGYPVFEAYQVHETHKSG